MSTLGQPVPPPPAAFTPDGVPPGIVWNPLPIRFQRPIMTAGKPRIALFHTNSAGEKSSLATQRRFADGSNTTPHYEVGLEEPDGTEKWLDTNRRGVGNGTVTSSTTYDNGEKPWFTRLNDDQRAQITEHGRSAEFSIVIETLDLGSNHGLGGATDYQGEMVARIFAYEAITHGFPVAEPDTWFGQGCSYHTAAVGNFPFWTIYVGKTCPGADKIADFHEWILPRAIEIHTAWTEGELANAEEIMQGIDDLKEQNAALGRKVDGLIKGEKARFALVRKWLGARPNNAKLAKAFDALSDVLSPDPK